MRHQRGLGALCHQYPQQMRQPPYAVGNPSGSGGTLAALRRSCAAAVTGPLPDALTKGTQVSPLGVASRTVTGVLSADSLHAAYAPWAMLP